MASSSLHHYSRYVSLMKIVLPLGILLTLGLSFGWPYFCSVDKEVSRPNVQENCMHHPRYMSTDNKDQPFEVTAELAKQRTESLIDLVIPQGLITLMEGQSLDLKAKNGSYDTEGKVLGLEGDVTLTSTDGYHIKTQNAQITLDTNVIEGNAPIQGQGPTGRIHAKNGFKVESREEGKIITLKGPSRVVINTASLKKKGQPYGP